jgi:hypothetical protein
VEIAMPRYSLRTLLILLAIGPPLGAGVWFYYIDYVKRQRLAAEQLEMEYIITSLYGMNNAILPPHPRNGLSWDVPYGKYQQAGSKDSD